MTTTVHGIIPVPALFYQLGMGDQERDILISLCISLLDLFAEVLHEEVWTSNMEKNSCTIQSFLHCTFGPGKAQET